MDQLAGAVQTAIKLGKRSKLSIDTFWFVLDKENSPANCAITLPPTNLDFKGIRLLIAMWNRLIVNYVTMPLIVKIDWKNMLKRIIRK